jgi:hypothetical protein
MKTKIIFLIFALFLFISCNQEKKESFKYFDFSYDNTFETCFSIQFTPNDSIYLREHWNYNDAFDSTNVPHEKTNYIAYISKIDRKKLIDLISKTRLKEYNSMYNQNYTDGSCYSIYIDKDSIKKRISVHSYKNVPSHLDSITSWIYKWKKTAKLQKTNKILNFKSVENFLPPPPPLPKIKD